VKWQPPYRLSSIINHMAEETLQQPINELERALVSDSAATPPSHILEGVSDELAHKRVSNAPHTIYGELWHIAFWQEITLEWIRGVETPVPEHASLGFASDAEVRRESWARLCDRFFEGNRQAGAAARNAANLDKLVRCPSQPGHPTRTMSIREQLESLAAHNAYHFGRIVLLRQLNGAWPPKSGGFTW
jgi:uncharacterized damage-inducible protein DinB